MVLFTSCSINADTELVNSSDSDGYILTTTEDSIKSSENPTTDCSTTDRLEAWKIELKEKYENIAAQITDDNYESVIAKTIPQDKFLSEADGFIPRFLDFIYMDQSYTTTIYSMFETEIIRKIDEHRMYSIYKIDSGGLFYCFYTNIPFIGFESPEDYIPELYFLHNTAYVCKKLSNSDFDFVNIGDDISVIEGINPATIVWREYFEKSKGSLYLQTILLTDGLLLIKYQRNADDTITVFDMEYNEDFKRRIDYSEFELPHLGIIEYDYRILPQDYPE